MKWYLMTETLVWILFINKIIHITQGIKGIFYEVYCTPKYLYCIYRCICACTNNRYCLNAFSCDHKMGKNLKVRAVKIIHVKTSTMCGIQVNNRGWNLNSMQNVSVGNALIIVQLCYCKLCYNFLIIIIFLNLESLLNYR